MSDQDAELLEGFGSRLGAVDDDDEAPDSDSSQSLALEQVENEDQNEDLPLAGCQSPMIPRPAQNKASKQRFGAALNVVMGGKGIGKGVVSKSEEELYEEKLGLHVPVKKVIDIRFSGMSKSSNHTTNSKMKNSFKSIDSEDLGSSDQDDSAASLSLPDEDDGDFFVDFPTNREEILENRNRGEEKDVIGESNLERIEQPLKVEEEIDQRKPWRRLLGVGSCEMSIDPGGLNAPLGGSNHISSGAAFTLGGSTHNLFGSCREIIVDDVDGYDNIGFYFEDEKKKKDGDTSSDITDYSTKSSVISELHKAKVALGWKDDEMSLGESVQSLSGSVKSLTRYGDSKSQTSNKKSINEPDPSREKERMAGKKTLPTIPDDGSVQSENPDRLSNNSPESQNPRRTSMDTLGELQREREGLGRKPRTLRESLGAGSFEEKSPSRSLNKNDVTANSLEDTNQPSRYPSQLKTSGSSFFSSSMFIEEDDSIASGGDIVVQHLNAQDSVRDGYTSNETTPSRDYELRRPTRDDHSVSSEASPFLRPNRGRGLKDNKQGSSQKLMRRSSRSLGVGIEETGLDGSQNHDKIFF